MAETTNLIQQAKSGSLSLSGLDAFLGRGTPNINQPNTPDIAPTSIRPDAPTDAAPAPAGVSLGGLDAFLGQQQPVPQGTPVTPDTVEQSSFMGDFVAPTAKDYGKLVVQGIAPTALGIIGGAAGTLLGPAGTIAGAAAGSALGTYFNDLLGIQDADVADYALAVGLPVAGGAISKAGKAVIKRLPSFQAAQQETGIKAARELAKVVQDDPGKKAVQGAYQALDEIGATMPTANLQDDFLKLRDVTQKRLVREFKNVEPEIVNALVDPSQVRMTPNSLREYKSGLNEIRGNLLKDTKSLLDKKQAAEIGDLIKKVDEHIDTFARHGDEGAIAIKRANDLAKQHATYNDIDLLLKNSIKSKVVDGQFVDEIPVASIRDRIRRIENILDVGKHSTDKLTKTVVALREKPEAFKAFKEGLENIAKHTPNGNITLIPQEGGGVITRLGRMAGQELNTGAMSRILGTPIGQRTVTRILDQSGGKLNPGSLTLLLTGIRPTLSGVLPKDDPIYQEVMGTIQGGVEKVKQPAQTPLK